MREDIKDFAKENQRKEISKSEFNKEASVAHRYAEFKEHIL